WRSDRPPLAGGARSDSRRETRAAIPQVPRDRTLRDRRRVSPAGGPTVDSAETSQRGSLWSPEPPYGQHLSGFDDRLESMRNGWRVAPVPEPVIEDLARATGFPPLIARLLARRGVTNRNEADAFLDPSPDRLHDPLLLHGIEEASEILTRAAAA